MPFTIENRPDLSPERIRFIAQRVVGRELRPVRIRGERRIQSLSSVGRFKVKGEVFADRFGIQLSFNLLNADKPVNPRYSTEFTVGELLKGLETGFPEVEITPVFAEALKFNIGGQDKFAARVVIPARPGKYYIRQLERDLKPQFLREARKGWQLALKVILLHT